MPELPEVETVVRSLRPHVAGRTVTGVEIYWPRTIHTPAPEAFRRELAGQRIDGVGRRGKFVIFCLERGDLLVHLRMTGQLLAAPPGAEPGLRHLRVALELDGVRLLFNDARKFGRMYLVASAQEWLAGLGPEPLNGELTVQGLAARLASRRAPVKSLLLDQHLLAGVGNIYADEALHAAHIAPQRPGCSLSQAEVVALRAGLQSVLERAIADRGTTLSDYRDGQGEPGRHQDVLQVYGRAGAPCSLCGGPIVRTRIGGRSAYHCPQCQH